MADDWAGFRARVEADMKRLPTAVADVVQRAIDKEAVFLAAARAWVETSAHLDLPSIFSAAWFEVARADFAANRFSHAIYDCERALELRPGFVEAADVLRDANARRDAGPWIVVQHSAYSRDDTEVAQCPNRATAEQRAKELNAQGGDHHWVTATT